MKQQATKLQQPRIFAHQEAMRIRERDRKRSSAKLALVKSQAVPVEKALPNPEPSSQSVMPLPELSLTSRVLLVVTGFALGWANGYFAGVGV